MLVYHLIIWYFVLRPNFLFVWTVQNSFRAFYNKTSVNIGNKSTQVSTRWPWSKWQLSIWSLLWGWNRGVNCSDEESGKRKGRPSGCHKVATNWVWSERGSYTGVFKIERCYSFGKTRRFFGMKGNPLPAGACYTKWPSYGVPTESLKLSELTNTVLLPSPGVG